MLYADRGYDVFSLINGNLEGNQLREPYSKYLTDEIERAKKYRNDYIERFGEKR